MPYLSLILLTLFWVTPTTVEEVPPAATQTLQFSPSPVTFGRVTITEKKYLTVTITNPGQTDYEVADIRVTRNINSSLTVFSNACGTTIPAGGNCSVQLLFAPVDRGTYHAALLVISANGNGYQYDELSGQGK